MKLSNFFALVLIALSGFFYTSCEKDDDKNGQPSNNDNNTQNHSGNDAIAIRAINTDTVDLEIVLSGNSSNAFIKYCYENDSCYRNDSGFSMSFVYPGNSSIIDMSADSINATAVGASLLIESGKGYFEVVRGDRIAEFMHDDFEPNEVIYTTDTFSAGYAEFAVGDTL